MRDKIWNELCQSRFSIELALLYEENSRIFKKYSTIGILVFSSSGIVGWKIWDVYPVIACIITTLLTILKIIQPHIISDEKLKGMIKINNFYFSYFNKLDKLWMNLNDNSIDESKAKNEFYKIKESEKEILNVVNENIIKPTKRLKHIAENRTMKYLEIHYLKQNKNEQRESTTNSTGVPTSTTI